MLFPAIFVVCSNPFSCKIFHEKVYFHFFSRKANMMRIALVPRSLYVDWRLPQINSIKKQNTSKSGKIYFYSLFDPLKLNGWKCYFLYGIGNILGYGDVRVTCLGNGKLLSTTKKRYGASRKKKREHFVRLRNWK